MNKMSIRLKITMWFSALLFLIVILTYVVIFSVDNSIMQHSVQDSLAEVVEGNVDEIEYAVSPNHEENDFGEDLYIPYGDYFLEIDDDYLDRVNGISTGLYQQDGTLLYGENPISKEIYTLSFIDMKVRKANVDGVVWYVFDRQLTQEQLNGLWLRGVVSSESEELRLSAVVRISLLLMPLLLLVAILGGYIIAGKLLEPMKHIVATASQISLGSDLKKRIDIGFGTDEIHQLATVFNGMLDRLDSSFEKEKQFTSDVSHELRTPMSVIMAQCEYSLEDERSDREYQKAMTVIQRQGRKMTRLIDDMLTFTRLEHYSWMKEMHKVNLSELVHNVSMDMAWLQENGITLETDVEPDIYIDGSHVLLTRLLTNLISNAYRYGKENGGIYVSLQGQSEHAVLSVSDDGIGIAENDSGKIFQRFFRSDNARSGYGTGLGLPMAQEIALIHGSSIKVESEIGVGSTFFVSFKRT